MVRGSFNSAIGIVMMINNTMRLCVGRAAGAALALLLVAAVAADAGAETSPLPSPPSATTAPVAEPPPAASTTAPLLGVSTPSARFTVSGRPRRVFPHRL